MDLKRPSCHEAGHAVVALFFGFFVEGIEAFEGRLRTMCQLDAEDKTDKERFVFLAGGIAGEQSGLGHYDSGGCNDDQKKISERGGESIETYLADAVGIVESNKECFRELRSKITIRAIERSMEMSISGGKNSFKLVTGDPTLRQYFVTVLLPFLAYFRPIGDESRRKRTKVSVTQVEEKARISSVLWAF